MPAGPRRDPLWWMLAAAAALCAGLTLARIAVFWTNEAYLDTVSGVWTALAVDLSNGVFYRPLFDPDGFGGTRYFPLHVVLHAAVIAIAGDPIRAGQIVAFLSIALLSAGVYAVVRSANGPRWLALASAASILASQTTQEALLSIKGDALPAALSLIGVAIVFRARGTSHPIAGPATLFALAFAAKPTAVYGPLACVLWLAGTSRPRVAARLATFTAAGALAVLAVTFLASDGRAFDSWVEGSSTLRLRDLVTSPLTFARLARQVPETLVFIQLGLAAAMAIAARARSVVSPLVLLMMTTLAVTVPIFALEGTDTNHLIDITAVSVAVVAGLVASLESPHRTFGIAALAVAVFAASLSLASGIVNRRTEQRHGLLAESLALIPDGTKPMLSENPLVAIAAGQRPYMLDSYMFRLIQQNRQPFAEPLWQALAAQAFSAVVLERDPHDERGREWYRSAFFGGGFVEELERHYERAGTVGMRIVYLPKR